MRTTNPPRSLPVTQFYLSFKGSISLGHRKESALAAERKDKGDEVCTAGPNDIWAGAPDGFKARFKKGGKGKGKSGRGKGRGRGNPEKGNRQRNKKHLQEIAKYLASSSARETDTASGETTAGIATKEKKGEKEKLTQLSSSRAKIKRPRKS
jgi:hypothetical protein